MTFLRLLPLFFLAAAASAQEPTGTLAKIKRTGQVVLGVRDGSIPFSYLDDKQQYQGYSVDLCLKVVEHLKTQLAMPGLKVAYNPVTSANRIPLMANGTIDLECGSTTNNAERQQQVAFAPTMFVISSRLLAKKSANIQSLEDMKGRVLVATAGTTTLKQMQLMTEKGLLVRSERFRSHVYEAGVPKEQTQQQIAGDLLARAFDGSAKSLVMGALAAQPASVEELDEIRRLIDSYEKNSSGKSGGKRGTR